MGLFNAGVDARRALEERKKRRAREGVEKARKAFKKQRDSIKS